MYNILDLNKQRIYSYLSSGLTNFFKNKGFIEVHCQSELSILAACEDPTTIGSFDYNGSVYPLPQTNQMNLERILLSNPDCNGVYCFTTSYRQEANPIEGRHDLIFPMFEFESKGTIDDLILLEIDLLKYLKFPLNHNIMHSYHDLCMQFNTKELTALEETNIWEDISDICFIRDFPEHTSPFWNMKRTGQTANKVDVILYGIETIGSAEREVNPEVMKQRFETISNGEYANLLYAQFGKDRVMKELNDFLSYDFFPRFGGGIGMTRLIRAMELLKQGE